jgi:hypothetical protein
MKLLVTAAILSVTAPFTFADFLPALATVAPDNSHVKQRIAPPANATLYDVYFARGNRVYQCNPELKGFQHWYIPPRVNKLHSTVKVRRLVN